MTRELPPASRARAIMVLGTSSHAGKSTIAAALCRSLARRGAKVAPFKAQNMSLNSWVTPEGGEIGRAQALQARAAGIEPHVDMNPLLLKPMGGSRMQVVALGKSIGNLTTSEYYARIGEMRALAHAAYDRLASRFDFIVLEGAGSPAEINLRDKDLVNLPMAMHAGARCLLVADIERGGVFASILGTVSLMSPAHRETLAGVLINKFRGDASLLDPGILEVEGLTGVPVLGVLPYLDLRGLEEEDSLGIPDGRPAGPARIDIVVIRFPSMSNFTDFQPLAGAAGVSLRYETRPESVGNPDLILLPGSKNVRRDADFLRGSGLTAVLAAAMDRRIPLLGICGGYQILGRTIRDPHGIEGEPGETPGLGFLPVETVLGKEKELCRVEAVNLAFPFLPEGAPCGGYEIHAGSTSITGSGTPLLANIRKNGKDVREPSGFASASAMVYGCYLHGLFDAQSVRSGLFRWLSRRKGLEWKDGEDPAGPEAVSPLDRLADALEGQFDPGVLLPQAGRPASQAGRPDGP